MNEELLTRNMAALFSRRSDVITGIGDDAAVLDSGSQDGTWLLAAADQVLEDVHFLPGTDPGKVAVKLLNRNISDIAAMGGRPAHALVTLALNPLDEAWLDAFNLALEDLASANGISVIGGDVARSPVPGKTASLTILGHVEKEKLCLRSNAKAGDVLYVTGSFGRSFPTGHHLTFRPRLEQARFLAGVYTCAMMDVSDGLAKDLARFAAASGITAEITELAHIPGRDGATGEEKLYDGEDYELLIAVPPEKCDALEKAWCFPDVPLTKAGIFEAGPQDLQEKGYDHFHHEN